MDPRFDVDHRIPETREWQKHGQKGSAVGQRTEGFDAHCSLRENQFLFPSSSSSPSSSLSRFSWPLIWCEKVHLAARTGLLIGRSFPAGFSSAHSGSPSINLSLLYPWNRMNLRSHCNLHCLLRDGHCEGRRHGLIGHNCLFSEEPVTRWTCMQIISQRRPLTRSRSA